MKKLAYFLFLSAFLAPFYSIMAQTSTATITDIFGESFDSVVTKWKMTPSIVPSNATSFFERDTIVTRDNSSGSAVDTVGDLGNSMNRVSSFLTTPFLMNVDTFPGLYISFEHICYIAQLDDATIEYSFDDVVWTRIPLANYFGNSRYVVPITGEVKFSKQSNFLLWEGANSNFIWDQTNTDQAWVREDFEITSLIQAEFMRTGAPVNLKIRFGLYDDASSILGREGTHIWYIDNFLIQGGDCEPIPPALTLFDPPENYPVRYKGEVYLTGPYQFKAQVTDRSGVDTVYIPYSVKRDISPTPVPNWQIIFTDTIGMDRAAGGNFSGEISGNLPNGDVIRPGDSVCWKVEAADGSACQNLRQDPSTGFDVFQVRPNLPPSCGTQPITEFPYFETFNGFGQAGSSILSNDWGNVTGDFHEWWVGQGVSTNDTTEFRIFDDFPGSGKYLYVESEKPNATGIFKDSTAFLLSPCIDLLDIPNGLVRFYVHMNTASLKDSIRIDVFDATPTIDFPDGQFVKNVIPPISGNRGNAWIPYEFSTFPYKNTITQIRFVGTPGDLAGKGDLGLDSFKIVPAPLIDARINNVNLPPFVPSSMPASEQVTVNVQNLGVAPINTITVAYEVCPDDSASCRTSSNPQVISGLNILPGQNMNLTLSELYSAPIGTYSVRAWISGHAGDAVPTNDTIFNRSRGLFYNTTNKRVKYMDDFDGANHWTIFSSVDSLDNNWELGEPNYDYTYSAYSGEKSWDVLLNRPYNGNGKVSTLISPYYDFSSADSMILSFINNRDIDTTKDGVFLEYSLDRGFTWDSLRSLGDPNRLKWYNSTVAGGGFGGQAVFSSNTYCLGNTWNGWLESELLLPDTLNNKSEVLFRFQFFAEFDDDGNDGMSIDNILIYDPDSSDLQAQHFLSPTSKCDLSSQQRITTIVKNRGLRDVSSFNMKYRITHVPTGTLEEKVDLVDLSGLTFPRPNVVEHRDSVHITSASTFNMFARGDYIVEVITQLPGDTCTLNDTLTQLVEHVEGCSLQFYIETSFRPNVQTPCDSTTWRFNYTSGGRDYEITRAYNSPSYPINRGFINDTIRDLFICIKDNSSVRFELDDRDTLIDNYSLIAFDGENDTIIKGQVTGGPDSPIQTFDWNCPPKLSATPTRIWIDDDLPQLPLAKSYNFSVNILNNGLDSLDSVQVFLRIDGDPASTIFNPVPFNPDLKYNRTKGKVGAGSAFLSPGRHEICIWTKLPNGKMDQRPSDDTICRFVTIMDTIRTMNNVYAPYCDNFDDTLNFPKWIAANPQDLLRQNEISLEQGTPSTTNISAASSGSFAWITNADGNYPNVDQSSVLSPFFLLEKDSCYGVSFMNNFYITDSIHDGGTLQMLDSDYSNYDENDWNVIGNSRGDTLDSIPGSIFRLQSGWYNTQHVLSLANSNDQNSGWTGNSNGWKLAQNLLPIADSTYYTALRWSFASDGSKVNEGWAIDDFCVENINVTNCFPVGLKDNLYEASDIYLGQNIPNPAALSTVIPYYIPRPGRVEFIVTNLLGQPVYQESLNHPSGDGLLELDLSDIAKGVYYYTMTYEEIRVTNKMVIVK